MESGMKLKVSDNWLKTCGMSQYSGQWFSARLMQSKSFSGMGNCYEVILPENRVWTVFACRGVEIVESF